MYGQETDPYAAVPPYTIGYDPNTPNYPAIPGVANSFHPSQTPYEYNNNHARFHGAVPPCTIGYDTSPTHLFLDAHGEWQETAASTRDPATIWIPLSAASPNSARIRHGRVVRHSAQSVGGGSRAVAGDPQAQRAQDGQAPASKLHGRRATILELSKGERKESASAHAHALPELACHP